MWYFVIILILVIIALCIIIFFLSGQKKREKLKEIEKDIKQKELELDQINTSILRGKAQLSEVDQAIEDYLDSMENNLNEVDTALIAGLKSKFRK